MNYLDSVFWGERSYAVRKALPMPRPAIPNENLIPTPCTWDESGAAHLKLYYPDAKSVIFHTLNEEFPLEKDGSFWTAARDIGPGFQTVWLTVDGVDTLCPYLPIGVGDNKPINFVDQEVQTPADVPHGTVCTEFVNNSVTGQLARVNVYLPPQYYTEPERRFPVLYLQHGHGENETVWVYQGRMNFTLDQLISVGKAAPMVVVMACGMLVVDAPDGKALRHTDFDRYLLNDILPHVENKYRVYADRSHRAMAGLSMGSIQTSVTAVRHPELFSAIGLFSGFFADVLKQADDHLAPEKLAAFKAAKPLFFRAMGTEDEYFWAFEADDKRIEDAGIVCDRRTYPGKHEWNVWRRCFHDFVQLIFQEKT